MTTTTQKANRLLATGATSALLLAFSALAPSSAGARGPSHAPIRTPGRAHVRAGFPEAVNPRRNPVSASSGPTIA